MENIGTRVIGKARFPGAPATDSRGRIHQASWSANASARKEARIAAERTVLETRIPISTSQDIIKARQTGSMLVRSMGFSGSRITLVNTVISELAQNILLYAKAGEIVLSQLDSAQLNVMAFDRGPGIENLPVVLSGGFSSSGGLGLGLSGLRGIVDEFEIKTQPGKGTQVFVGIHA